MAEYQPMSFLAGENFSESRYEMLSQFAEDIYTRYPGCHIAKSIVLDFYHRLLPEEEIIQALLETRASRFIAVFCPGYSTNNHTLICYELTASSPEDQDLTRQRVIGFCRPPVEDRNMGTLLENIATFAQKDNFHRISPIFDRETSE